MKGFILTLIGNLLSINAVVSAFLPSTILKEINTTEAMSMQSIMQNSPIMIFLALSGIELTLVGLVVCISGLVNKKGSKCFNILGIVLSFLGLILPGALFS